MTCTFVNTASQVKSSVASITAALLCAVALSTRPGMVLIPSTRLRLVRLHGIAFLLSGMLSLFRTGLPLLPALLRLALLRRLYSGIDLIHFFHV